MTQFTTRIGRTARRLPVLAVSLLVGTTGTAAAHDGASSGGMMGGGWGLAGGTMGLWGLLWMGLLLAVPLLLAYWLFARGSAGPERRGSTGDHPDERSLSLLRERYARGELSEEEFDRRWDRLNRLG